MQGVSFSLDDDTVALDQAREKAWNLARAKADQLAKLGGRELGPITSITDVVNSSATRFAAVNQAIGGGSSSPNINPGQVSTKVTVTVRFSFK